MILRCQCYGQCGKVGAMRRVCADPDLTGRCRAESGSVHPRSDQVIRITEVNVAPGEWRALCDDCRRTYESGMALTYQRRVDPDLYFALFPERDS